MKMRFVGRPSIAVLNPHNVVRIGSFNARPRPRAYSCRQRPPVQRPRSNCCDTQRCCSYSRALVSELNCSCTQRSSASSSSTRCSNRARLISDSRTPFFMAHPKGTFMCGSAAASPGHNVEPSCWLLCRVSDTQPAACLEFARISVRRDPIWPGLECGHFLAGRSRAAAPAQLPDARSPDRSARCRRAVSPQPVPRKHHGGRARSASRLGRCGSIRHLSVREAEAPCRVP